MQRTGLGATAVVAVGAVAVTAWLVPAALPGHAATASAAEVSTTSESPTSVVGRQAALRRPDGATTKAGHVVFADFPGVPSGPRSRLLSATAVANAGAAAPYLRASLVVAGHPASQHPGTVRVGWSRELSTDGSVALNQARIPAADFWVALRLASDAPAAVQRQWTTTHVRLRLDLRQQVPSQPSSSPAPSPTQSTFPSPSSSPSPSPSVSTSPTASPSPSPTNPAPSSTTLFGSTAQNVKGESGTAAVARIRGQFGRLGVVRLFDHGNATPWKGIERQVGTTPVVESFRPTPQAVLSGALDNYYRNWFATAPRDRVTYWSYSHEPEDNIEHREFTGAQYRAAWVRLKGLANQAHNSQLKATLILMGWSIQPHSGRSFETYYPGSNVIDVLSWDVYNHAGKDGSYGPAANLYADVIAKSRSLGKPFGISETASVLAAGDNGSARAAWLTQMAHYLSAQHSLYVTYFNSFLGVDYRLQDRPSVAAWRAVCTQG